METPVGARLSSVDALLAEGDADREGPRELGRAISAGEMTLVLYGAGTVGREVLSRLRGGGVEPVAFADDTPAKQGSYVDGLPVVSAADAAAKWAPRVCLAVTMVNPALPYRDAARRLRAIGGDRVTSVFGLARAFPELLLPFGPIDAAERLFGDAARISEAARLFTSDPESRKQFLGQLRFRIGLDFDALPPRTVPAYLTPEIVALLPSPLRFVDCGAYDGDTLRDLVAYHGWPEGVVAFEPDPRNFRRLSDYLSTLPRHLVTTIQAHRAAVGERPDQLPFQPSGDTAASIRPDGSGRVAVVRIDDVVEKSGPRLYVKLDVEGAECAALRGAERLIRSAQPLLAVSVYHRPADLWAIPLYLSSLDVGYRFLLRTHGHDGTDVICYAIPRWALS